MLFGADWSVDSKKWYWTYRVECAGGMRFIGADVKHATLLTERMRPVLYPTLPRSVRGAVRHIAMLRRQIEQDMLDATAFLDLADRLAGLDTAKDGDRHCWRHKPEIETDLLRRLKPAQ